MIARADIRKRRSRSAGHSPPRLKTLPPSAKSHRGSKITPRRYHQHTNCTHCRRKDTATPSRKRARDIAGSLNSP